MLTFRLGKRLFVQEVTRQTLRGLKHCEEPGRVVIRWRRPPACELLLARLPRRSRHLCAKTRLLPGPPARLGDWRPIQASRGAPTKSSIARRRTAPTGSPESSHRRFARDFPIEPARDTPPRRGAHWYSAARPNRPKLGESDPTGEGGSALSGARWAGRTAPRPLFQGHQKW